MNRPSPIDHIPNAEWNLAGDLSELAIELHPAEVERKKQQRAFRLHAIDVPRLRVLGFTLLFFGVLAHNTWLTPPLDWTSMGWLAAVMIGYMLLSWAALYRLFERITLFDLGVFFMVTDLFVWTAAIYVSGGEKSLLFFILLLRIADQANTEFRRALFFAQVATLSYFLMLLYIVFVDLRMLYWPAEATKLLFIYGASLYLSLTARTAERRRNRTAASIRMARYLITQLEEKSRELEEAKIRAEGGSRAKSEFLANISHEIRTPLNGILGITQLALSADQNPEQQRLLETIRTSAEMLLKVINDVLDFSKVEAQKLMLDPIDFQLRHMLGETLKILGTHAHDKNIELLCHVLPDVPDDLVGDAQRLGQIIVNLVGNALKFTESGEVVLRVQLSTRTAQETLLHFTVSDTGIGIPSEKQDAIFQPFAQADGSTTRKYGGTGLGLAIANQLVELMGGTVWVESAVGAGSSFHFTARFALAAEPAKVSLDLSPVKGSPFLPVLIADDNDTSRHILSQSFRGWGMRPVDVSTGRTAIESMFEAGALGRHYGLVVLDADLRDVSGFSVAEQIKSTPAISCPVIMMLASVVDPRASRCREMGIESYLTKPVTHSELYSAVASVFAPRRDSAPTNTASRRTPRRSARSLHVLLAEDNPVNQELTVAFLQRWGHSVVVTGDGLRALEAYERELFDLIIMDVQMPVMDGFETTRKIRDIERKTSRYVPIIAMTAHAMAGDRERCLAAGMNQYIAKPILEKALFVVIEGFAGARPEQTEGAVAMGRSDVIARVGGDELLARRIASLFLENYPLLLEGIREAARNHDAPALRNVAHTLKGSVSNFPAEEAFKAAQRLEVMAHNGDLTDFDSAFEALQKAVERLRPALEELMGLKTPA